MSRVGKKPVKVPANVKVEVTGNLVKIGSGSDALTINVRPEINVKYDSDAGEVVVTRNGDLRLHKALHGTTRALIANMILGVTQGFSRGLKIFGTGYNIAVQGRNLVVNVGFAHSVSLPIPDGVKVDIKSPNARGNDVPAEFIVSGPDKWAVGQFAASIRQVRPPEPYLGKGIRYVDEVVKKKVGKAFGSSA